MEVFKNTGKMLQVRRKNMGLTQQEVADNCGMHVQYVSNFERGKCLPPRHAMKKLCKFLKWDRTDKSIFLHAINVDMQENNERIYKDLL